MRRVGAILAVAAGAGAPAAGQTWTSLGPAPITGFAGATGRVSALACHPTDPNLYYAGGADGGVWRTLDGGQTWAPLTDHLPSSAIGALALEPGNPSTVYAGSGEANFATTAATAWASTRAPTAARPGRCWARRPSPGGASRGWRSTPRARSGSSRR